MINIMTLLYFTQILIIGMTLLTAWKYGKLKHSATYLAVAVNLYTCFIEPIGKSLRVQELLEAVIQG